MGRLDHKTSGISGQSSDSNTRGSVPHRGLLPPLLATAALLAWGAVLLAQPRNVRLLQTQQVADQITTTVRWNAPQNPRGTPPPEQYEVEVRDDTVLLANSLGESDTRALQFRVAYPCGDTLRLNARVRAWNTVWPQPSAWAQSATETWFRPCPVVISGPPEGVTVESEADTIATGPADTVPPLGVTDLTYLGDLTLAWTEVGDGAGGAANYALRFGCPSLSWSAAFPTEVHIQGTQVGNTATVAIAPPLPPCDYRMVSYRGTYLEDEQRLDGIFGGFSNVVTVTDAALTEPVALLPLTMYADGTARWVHEEFDQRFHMREGETVRMCWYGVSEPIASHADDTHQVLVYGKWPADCPTTQIGLPADLPVYDDSQISLRCQGQDSVWTPWVNAEGASLTCGEQSRIEVLATN